MRTAFRPRNIVFYTRTADLSAQQGGRVFLEGSGGGIAEKRAAARLHIALSTMLDACGSLRIGAFIRTLHQLAFLDSQPTDA